MLIELPLYKGISFVSCRAVVLLSEVDRVGSGIIGYVLLSEVDHVGSGIIGYVLFSEV